MSSVGPMALSGCVKVRDLPFSVQLIAFRIFRLNVGKKIAYTNGLATELNVAKSTLTFCIGPLIS